MKKIQLFLLFWLACCLGVSAQQLEVSGVVSQNGAPVSNHPVSIYTTDANFDTTLFATVLTNPNGFYQTELNEISPALLITTPNCHSDSATLTRLIIFALGDTATGVNFELCSTQRCEADFEYEVAATNAGFMVHFFGLTFPEGSADIYEYLWKFEDGTQSTDRNVTHFFPTPGEYEICFEIEIPGQCSDRICKVIQVGQEGPCTAEFNYFPSPNTPVGFQFVSVVDSLGLDFQHQWRFGDGTESSEVSPYHEFPGPGRYEVCLLVWDSISNCERDFCRVIEIHGSDNCIADFSYEIDSLGTVYFRNQSHASFPLGELTYFWTFGDGEFSMEKDPIHDYQIIDYATFEVCLVIRDNLGCVDSVCKTITIGNPPNACNARFRYEPTASGNYFFITDTSEVYEAYIWNFGDGTSFLGGPIEDHHFESPGEYVVCLVVEDGRLNCRDEYCDTIIVGNPNCEAAFSYYVDSTSTTVFFEFDGRSNDFDQNFLWDFGDGNTSREENPFHLYENPGDYEVCLKIWSDQDTACFDYVCKTIWIGSIDCRSEFEYAIDPNHENTVIFEAAIPQTDHALVYKWFFADGTTAEGDRVRHEFGGPGTYRVCLEVMTPDGSCKDEICKEIVIGEGDCDATFSYTEPASLERVFVANTIMDGLRYTWFFGDGNLMEHGPIVDHRFSRPGVYLVCLTVSNGVDCETTYCDSVSIEGGFGNCIANFSYLIEPGNIYRFQSQSQASIPGGDLRYHWDFGDGTTSTERNPIHAFLNAGNYEVCLTITDNAGCEARFCQNLGGYDIDGEVFANGDRVSNGQAFLIYHDPINQTLTAIDTVPVQRGRYRFTNVGPGTYLVKAALNTNSIYYRDFLPTYLGDKLFWHQAISIVIASSGVQLPPINLLPGANPGGSGFIGGLISQGANKQSEGLENISVLLLSENGQEISHTLSDEDGIYSFADLGYGTYKVYVEIPGKLSNPWIVTIGPDTPSFDEADFEVGEVSITTGFKPIHFDSNIALYPNPARDVLYIKLAMHTFSDVQLSLMNMTGQVLIQNQQTLQKGNHDLNININHLPEGVYILNIRVNEQSVAKRVVVRQ